MSSRDDPFVEALRVRAVLERYCVLLDSGAVDDLLGLFDDSCVVSMMGRTYEGKSEFAGVWSGAQPVERPTTLHALVNPDVQVDGARATARSNFVLVKRGSDGDTQIAFAGCYIDELRRGSTGAWRFTRRRVETLARSAA